ncbi:MAG TPA: DUF2267 domain-containing protein [Cytophagaceae bacterium]
MIRIQKLNHRSFELFAELSRELDCVGDTIKAERILKKVLQALRNYMPLDCSIEIVSVLPPHLKSLYHDEWKISQAKDWFSFSFYEELKKADAHYGQRDFHDNGKAVELTKKTLKVIYRSIPDQKSYVLNQWLPEELKIDTNELLIAC